MAIEYVKVKRLISVGRTPGEKFLARIKRGQMISEKELCDEIAESCTLTRGEVKLVIEQLQYNITRHARNGESVKLNDLGIFYPEIKATAMDSADAVTADTIKDKKLRFRANVETVKAMKSSELKLANMQINGLQQ